MARNKSHVIARLTKARDFLAQPRTWRRGQLCYIEKGKVVGACALGALYSVDPAFRTNLVPSRFEEEDSYWSWNPKDTNNELIHECADELDRTAFQRGGYSAITYNDTVAQGKRDVIRLYDATIQRLNAS